MLNAAQSILKHGRTAELDEKLLSIKEVLTLIPGGK
jgi:phosphoenolpyruvate phosphomutase